MCAGSVRFPIRVDEVLTIIITDADLTAMTARIVETIHPERIILFGLVARGEADEDSDIDLLVVVAIRFMSYAMRYANWEEMQAIGEHVTDAEFREAIDGAPPGMIDARSWAWWNVKILDRYPPPPLPMRTLD